MDKQTKIEKCRHDQSLTMIRAHKIRLNPTPEQATYFAKAVGTRRFVFNWELAEWKRQHETGGKPSALALKQQFNALKRKQFPWVYEVTKCAVEGAFADLGKAFTNFFEGRAGYPTFKAKKRSNESFYLANDKFSVEGHTIRIPKLGAVNMTEVLRFEGKLVSATVSLKAGWWFVSIHVDVPKRTPVRREKQVGIDVGIKRLATLSDGRGFENQKPLRGLLVKLKRLNQDLARKQKGSANREKARLKVARLHYRVACIRDDLLHKLTTSVAETYGFVGIETLNVKGLVKNRALSQALSDAALGRLLRLLKSKVVAQGGVVQEVGRFFPSSKRCSACGHVKANLVLSEREYRCEACGVTLDRDHNASLNILHEALRLFESSPQ